MMPVFCCCCCFCLCYAHCPWWHSWVRSIRQLLMPLQHSNIELSIYHLMWVAPLLSTPWCPRESETLTVTCGCFGPYSLVLNTWWSYRFTTDNIPSPSCWQWVWTGHLYSFACWYLLQICHLQPCLSPQCPSLAYCATCLWRSQPFHVANQFLISPHCCATNPYEGNWHSSYPMTVSVPEHAPDRVVQSQVFKPHCCRFMGYCLLFRCSGIPLLASPCSIHQD